MISDLEPRYKLLFIPHHFVLESVIFCLTGNDGYPPRWKIINAFVDGYGQIPHDTEIRHVTIPFIRRGFLFTLYHKSFDVVGDFAEIPEIKWDVGREIVETQSIPVVNFPSIMVEKLKEEDALKESMSGISEPLSKDDPVINFFK